MQEVTINSDLSKTSSMTMDTVMGDNGLHTQVSAQTRLADQMKVNENAKGGLTAKETASVSMDTIDRKVFRNSIDIALRMPPSERTRVRDQKLRALRNQEEKLMQLPREAESSTRTRRLAKMAPEAHQASENLLKHLREEREADIMNKADMPNTAVPSPRCRSRKEDQRSV
jgi:hypothetical protein